MSSARLAHHVTYIHIHTPRPPPLPSHPILLLAGYHGNRLSYPPPPQSFLTSWLSLDPCIHPSPLSPSASEFLPPPRPHSPLIHTHAHTRAFIQYFTDPDTEQRCTWVILLTNITNMSIHEQSHFHHNLFLNYSTQSRSSFPCSNGHEHFEAIEITDAALHRLNEQQIETHI